MLKRRYATLLSILLIMGLILSACGVPGDNKEPPAGTTQEQAAPVTDSGESQEPVIPFYEVGDTCTLKTFDGIDYTLDPNADAYLPENVESLDETLLTGKTFYWLGSSVFAGSLAKNYAVPDYIAARNGAVCIKEAAGGTCMFGEANSYWQRLTETDKFDKEAQVDAFFCQVSTNDSSSVEKRGQVTASDVTELERFDTGTTAGAMEYIVAYVTQTWHCPVYFISGSYYGQAKKFDGEYRDNSAGGENYAEVVALAQKVADKWNQMEDVTCGMLDLYNDDAFNYISADDYSYFMNVSKQKKEYVIDPVHPRMAGYLYWWTPYVEEFITEVLTTN